MDCYVLHKTFGVRPAENCITHSKVKKLIEINIKTAFQNATRRIITGIAGESIEGAFKVGYGTKKRIKTCIRSVVEDALINIVEQDRPIQFWCLAETK